MHLGKAQGLHSCLKIMRICHSLKYRSQHPFSNHKMQGNFTCLGLLSDEGLLSRSAAGSSAVTASSASAPDFLGLRRLHEPLLRSAVAVLAAMPGAALPSPSSELCDRAPHQPDASPKQKRQLCNGGDIKH